MKGIISKKEARKLYNFLLSNSYEDGLGRSGEFLLLLRGNIVFAVVKEWTAYGSTIHSLFVNSLPIEDIDECYTNLWSISHATGYRYEDFYFSQRELSEVGEEEKFHLIARRRLTDRFIDR